MPLYDEAVRLSGQLAQWVVIHLSGIKARTVYRRFYRLGDFIIII